MFYEGSLQEGISAAVGQQKLVFCFVTGKLRGNRRRSLVLTWVDGNEESTTWENEFLQDLSVRFHSNWGFAQMHY